MGVRPVGPEMAYGFGDATHDEVVAEVHREVVVAEIGVGNADGVSDSQGFMLGDVRDFEAEF